MFFPAVPGTVAEDPDSIEWADTERGHFVGRVLLVDDEEIVLDVCASQLEALGLEVLIARDGQGGVDIYQEYQGDIDLVILDYSYNFV